MKESEVVSEIVNIPIEAPDLVNHVRFSRVDNIKHTSEIPSHVVKAATMRSKATNRTILPKKTKKNRKKKEFTSVHDGYKYMNKREDLIEQLEEKKMKNSKLAYKVTQCYPLSGTYMSKSVASLGAANWNDRPAGKVFPEGEHVCELFASQVYS